MQIVMRKTSEIVPYERNPRKNENAVDAVAESIRQFGFKVPIVLDKDNVIIAGHTRLKAAEKLGLEEVPTITADDLTPEQVKAFRLADNKTGELAGWDFMLLDEELLELGDIDMTAFGFEPEGTTDVSDLFGDAPEKDPEPKMVTCPHCGETFEL